MSRLRRGSLFLRRPYKNIDDVLASAVHQYRHRSSSNNVQSSALQRKSIVREIVNRRSEVEFAVEPRLYRVLIGGHHIFQMTRLK